MSKRPSLDLRAAVAAPAEEPVFLSLAQLIASHEALRPHLALGPRLRKWADPDTGLGATMAWDVTPEMLHKATDAMKAAGYAPSTANRDLAALGQVFKWAIFERKLAPKGFVSPTLRVPRAPEPIRRVEFTDTDVQRLRDAAAASKNRRFCLFVWMLTDSGCRKSEILERTWAEFDLDAGSVAVPKTKNGDARTLLFRPETVALAKSLRPAKGREGTLIFPGRRFKDAPMDFRRPWSELVAELGWPGMHIHDVRHAVAASLLRSGATVAVAAQVLGHRDHTMLTRRYGHLEVGALAAAQKARWSTGGTVCPA